MSGLKNPTDHDRRRSVPGRMRRWFFFYQARVRRPRDKRRRSPSDMKLLSFIKTESPDDWAFIVALTVGAGLADSVILALVNFAASETAGSLTHTLFFALFVGAVGVMVFSKRLSLARSVALTERVVNRMRLRMVDKIRRTELPFIEANGKGEIHTRVSQDFNLISQAAFLIINASQGIVMVVCALVYLAWLSPVTCGVTLACIAVGGWVYHRSARATWETYQRLMLKDRELYDSFAQVLDGFRELRLNQPKSDSLFATFSGLAEESNGMKASTSLQFVSNLMFNQVFLYMLLALVVFALPRLFPAYGEVLVKTTVAVMFIVGPLEMMVNAAPFMARANASLSGLYALETRIDQAVTADTVPAETSAPAPLPFESVTLREVAFHYRDEHGVNTFVLGPLDLSIRRGDLVFFVGGNGSGKSTLLKLLVGLYAPTEGGLIMNGQRIDERNRNAYRECFGAVFADFHLFDRLYGVEAIDDRSVNRWLDQMGIGEKTQCEGGRFSHVKLSTGQRKRLALVMAMMDDKAVYVFDEWAADQDFHFRESYYTELLPALRAKGKTVLASTHDERFWHVADRVVQLEYGKIVRDGPPV